MKLKASVTWSSIHYSTIRFVKWIVRSFVLRQVRSFLPLYILHQTLCFWLESIALSVRFSSFFSYRFSAQWNVCASIYYITYRKPLSLSSGDESCSDKFWKDELEKKEEKSYTFSVRSYRYSIQCSYVYCVCALCIDHITDGMCRHVNRNSQQLFIHMHILKCGLLDILYGHMWRVSAHEHYWLLAVGCWLLATGLVNVSNCRALKQTILDFSFCIN